MLSNIPDVCVIGLGYIGLPTALVLADKGLRVHGVDINPEIVKTLNRGKVPISEPGLEQLLQNSLEKNSFSVSDTAMNAKSFIIAVPTPLVTGDTAKHANLSFIDSAVDTIIPLLVGDELIINESTSPPGTTEAIANRIVKSREDLSLEPNLQNSIYVAHCPERVIPGRTLIELRENSRVIGGINAESYERSRSLYEEFCLGELLQSDATTAELTKLAENSFRDVNIAFANELSDISEHLGINVWDVINLANRHPRVEILKPGPGVGGHCIAVDPWFIHQAAPSHANIIKTARLSNDTRPERIVSNIVDSIGFNQDARICVLGLAFKANVEDLRESPAVTIVQSLARRLPDSKFDVVEPYIESLPLSISQYSNLELLTSAPSLAEYNAVLLLTDHDEFRDLEDPSSPETVVFDTRGMWE